MQPPHPDYRPLPTPNQFFDPTGPYFTRLEDGAPLIGFYVSEKHINPNGVCHGGVITCLADMQSLPASYLGKLTDRLMPTISLTTDFIGPAVEGDWVELRTTLLKATNRLLFTQATIATGQGNLVARSSAVFKIPSSPHSGPVPKLFG